MGIFSMVFGVVVFFGCTGGGYILARGINSVLAQEIMGQTVAQSFKMSSSTVSPVPIIVVCAFVGFLIGLSFFMKGLTYQKLASIERFLEEE